MYPVGRGSSCSKRIQVQVPQAVVVDEPRAGWPPSREARGGQVTDGRLESHGWKWARGG